MNNRYSLFIFHILIALSPVFSIQAESCETVSQSIGQIQVRFLSKENGEAYIVKPDEFTHSLNPLNRSLRLMMPQAISEVEFFEYLSKQVRCWDKDEIDIISYDLKVLEKKITRLNPRKFRLSIDLIKTSGKDEGGANYTRGRFIAVPNGRISRHVLAHEIFHIFSRSHPENKDILYGLIGFRPINSQLPKSLLSKIIVNPDAPEISHYIEVKYNNEYIKVTPVVMSTVDVGEINPDDNLFDYANINLISISDGSIISIKDTDYSELVGANTEYIIHPEEILAENFSFLINDERAPDSNFLHRLKTVLNQL